jgi:hypothetical protein
MLTRAELNQLRTGYLTSSKDFDDYRFKAGEPMPIRNGVVFPKHGDEVILGNNEIRDDLLPFLSWSEKK